MKAFLVSYRAQAAIIVAEVKIDARELFQEKFLKGSNPDKRKIKIAEVPGLLWSGPALSKPKVLKTAVLVDGGGEG